MASPTAAFAGAGSGPESRRSPRISELWNITGDTSADGNTVAITTRYIHSPQIVMGAVSYSVSGRVVTCTLMAALAAAEVIGIEIVGLP